MSFHNRICSQYSQLVIMYLLHSVVGVPGSFVDIVIEMGASPLHVYSDHNFAPPNNEPNGVVNSYICLF